MVLPSAFTGKNQSGFIPDSQESCCVTVDWYENFHGVSGLSVENGDAGNPSLLYSEAAGTFDHP